MQSSVQIQFPTTDPSEAGKTVINKRVPRLDRAYPNIMNCRLSVDPLSKKKLHCGSYHPGIDIGLPRREVVVNHIPDSHHSGTETPAGGVRLRVHIILPDLDKCTC